MRSRHSLPIIPVLILFGFAIANAITITVNPAVTHQTITGLGAGAVEETDRQAQIDEAYKDLGATTHRLLQDYDFFRFEPTNDNNDPNTFNWANFKIHTGMRDMIRYVRTAKAAGNNHFFFTQIAVPTWMKVNIPNQSTIYWPDGSNAFHCEGQCGGDFDTTKYAEYAECLSAWFKVFKDSIPGFEFNAVGLQNEPSFNEPYGSCIVPPPVYRNLAKVVAARLIKDGYKTKVIVSEEVMVNWASLRSYITTSFSDAVLRPDLNAIAVHNYAGNGITATSPSALSWSALGKLIDQYKTEGWMTETSGFSNDWDGAMRGNQVLYSALKYGHLSLWAWLEFPKKAANADIFAATKQFLKFIRPGAIHIESSTNDTSVMPVAFRDKATNRLVVVLINPSSTEKTVSLAGTEIPPNFQVTQSNVSNKFVDAGSQSASSVKLLPNSITTLVGEGYNPTVSVRSFPMQGIKAGATDKGRVFTIQGRQSVGLMKTAQGVFVRSTAGRSVRMVSIDATR